VKEYTDIVYRYYPKDIYVSAPRYPSTPENVRQRDLIEDASQNKANNIPFENMMAELSRYLNCYDHEDFSLRGALIFVGNPFFISPKTTTMRSILTV